MKTQFPGAPARFPTSHAVCLMIHSNGSGAIHPAFSTILPAQPWMIPDRPGQRIIAAAIPSMHDDSVLTNHCENVMNTAMYNRQSALLFQVAAGVIARAKGVKMQSGGCVDGFSGSCSDRQVVRRIYRSGHLSPICGRASNGFAGGWRRAMRCCRRRHIQGVTGIDR